MFEQMCLIGIISATPADISTTRTKVKSMVADTVFSLLQAKQIDIFPYVVK
jgi:hypothetical protein